MPTPPRLLTLLLFAIAVLAGLSSAYSQIDFEGAPIEYDTRPPEDPVAHLQEQLSAGDTELTWDDEHGYLRSLLTALEIPVESQMLVFSKTSFQLDRISPQRPRAIYFSDDVYIGWVQGGDVIEVSATDPLQGPIFYTLRQSPGDAPQFVRQTDNCTQCHASSLTRGFPGHIIRSIVPDPDGQPILRAGTSVVDHTTPLADRWGGWYVTGTHGSQTHMGNTCAAERDNPESFDSTSGGNRTSLEGLLNTRPYLSPHSDLVALMVLEHQAFVHNQIVRANYQTRLALFQQAEMNRMLDREGDYISETTEHLLDNTATRMARAMLLSGETRLSEPVAGTSGFAEAFAARGPFDPAGRSLRQLDLQRRLFRYPCSYLIYSEAFDTLPEAVRQRVLRQIWEVLTGQDRSEFYAHLSAEDREAILEILRATKPNLPDYWQS